MIYNLILVGNPNTGKTTLFNCMTKSNEKASNWHGVTVDIKKKKCKFKQNEVVVSDLPGIYSLKGYSKEECIATDYLNQHKNDFVINICDANNIKRNLLLTCDLINRGFKVVVVVNMNNETKVCDYEKLEKELGVKIIPIDARKRTDVNKLYSYLLNYAIKYKTQNNKINTINYNSLIKNSKIFININPYKQSDFIDKILLNKILFIPIFILLMYFVFFITFGEVGCFITDQINIYFNKIAKLLKMFVITMHFPVFINNFICEAVIDGCFSILGFLPQIIMLMFFVNLIEDIGIMSRFSFMFDGFLKRVGLTGKSLFSIFMGFGCSTSAMLTTRNLETMKLRKSTTSAISFIPCSAKLPVFLVMASIFFESYKHLIVFALYIFSVIVSIFAAYIVNKKTKCEVDYFILEMPKIRFPNISKILKDVILTIKDFFAKIAKIILIFSVLVWILQNISTNFIYLNGQNFDKSLLYFFASKISFLFEPIGLNNVGVVVALLLGLCAKELIVVGLCVINGVESNISILTASLMSSSSVCCFSEISSMVFLVFILLYSPCISALSTIKNEIDKKYLFKLFISQMVLAYLISFVVYMCLTEINFLYLGLSILFVVFLIRFMLKFRSSIKIKCQGNCDACRKI